MPYAPLLEDGEIVAALARLPAWRREERAIVRDVRFPTFVAAIAFVDRVAAVAEEADHHPDIDIRWRRIRVVLTTHASGGLTARDIDMAERIDRIADEALVA
jgi:4a-hydroxytetrahydrobiopterin dehydratase